MAAQAVQMHCSSCGFTWRVQPRPDGRMPHQSRCPRHLGGCGQQRRVPRVARETDPAPAAPGAGDPPVELRAPRQAAAAPGTMNALLAGAVGGFIAWFVAEMVRGGH